MNVKPNFDVAKDNVFVVTGDGFNSGYKLTELDKLIADTIITVLKDIDVLMAELESNFDKHRIDLFCIKHNLDIEIESNRNKLTLVSNLLKKENSEATNKGKAYTFHNFDSFFVTKQFMQIFLDKVYKGKRVESNELQQQIKNIQEDLTKVELNKTNIAQFNFGNDLKLYMGKDHINPELEPKPSFDSRSMFHLLSKNSTVIKGLLDNKKEDK